MRLEGRILRDGRWWVAEIPMLDAMTQGRTRKDLLAMVADLVRTLADDAELNVSVLWDRTGRMEIESSEPEKLVALLLRRRRQKAGLTLEEVAARLGQTSRNAYARYEQGRSVPSVTRLGELLGAVNAESDFVIRESRVPYRSDRSRR